MSELTASKRPWMQFEKQYSLDRGKHLFFEDVEDSSPEECAITVVSLVAAIVAPNRKQICVLPRQLA